MLLPRAVFWETKKSLIPGLDEQARGHGIQRKSLGEGGGGGLKLRPYRVKELYLPENVLAKECPGDTCHGRGVPCFHFARLLT